MRVSVIGSSAIACAIAACAYDPPDATQVDASPSIDAPRSLGILDGECQGDPGGPRVMVYTYENTWRHLSNVYARLALYDMCTSRGFNVVTTNDPYSINATRLAQVDVVVFSITSGPGIDARGRADLEAWIRAGGGLVGLHSAGATEQQWPFFAENMPGVVFATHAPGMQRATVRVEPGGHPITEGLPAAFQHADEWYVFQTRPEDVPGMQMLITLDEDTLPADYPPETKIGYHAVAWAHERFGGRVFYTSMIHNPDSFEEPAIADLVAQAIEWAAHRR